MNERKVEVLRRIQNEEITAEQGAKLLDEIENPVEVKEEVRLDSNPVKVETKNTDGNGKMFRINILSSDGDKVNVKIPLSFAKLVLSKSGGLLNKKISADVDIDVAEILEMIDQGNVGKLVDIESADGDIVQIVID